MLNRVFVVFLVLGLALLPALSHAATSIGKVVATSGSPGATGPGGDRRLSAGSAVFENDKISVPGNGNVQILLRDDTKLVVGPGSSLLLDRFVLRGKNTAKTVSLKALRGTFRLITGKSPKQAYDISSTTATIGIRGTGFDFWVKGQTGVAVMQGLVELCSLKGKGSSKKCVKLKDACEVGRANRNSASGYGSRDSAGRNIRNNLPYINNQNGLNRTFWLPTGKCSKTLRAIKEDVDNRKERRDGRRDDDDDDTCGGDDSPCG